MEQDKNVFEDRVEEVRQKLVNVELQKDNLLKKVDYFEEEIKKKRKELNILDNQNVIVYNNLIVDQVI